MYFNHESMVNTGQTIDCEQWDYIYITIYMYMFMYIIPVEIFLTESEASRPVQNGFWLPFCAKSRRWVLPSCKDPPPGPVFVSILEDFGALIPPSPDHSVGLFNDYKLDGFKWGIDNGQIWPLQSGWNQRIVKQYSKLGIFQILFFGLNPPVDGLPKSWHYFCSICSC